METCNEDLSWNSLNFKSCAKTTWWEVSKCVLLLWSSGMRMLTVLFYTEWLYKRSRCWWWRKQESTRELKPCVLIWGTISTTTARSIRHVRCRVKTSRVCSLNDWKKALDVKSKCKWINWESKKRAFVLLYTWHWCSCGIFNKNIIPWIFKLQSSDERDFVSNRFAVDSFMCGSRHFLAPELEMLRHRNLIDNIVSVKNWKWNFFPFPPCQLL